MDIEYIENIKNITIIFTRNKRDQLLQQSDKYLLPDYPISPEKLELIKDYRQKLRDYTKLDGFINYNSSSNMTLPELPTLPF